VIDPCIPGDWPGFTVKRRFRGAEFRITVQNPEHVQCGVREMMMDGSPCAADAGPREKFVPVCPPGSTHDVLVILGPAEAAAARGKER
jgi:cellobiose phosphorylase